MPGPKMGPRPPDFDEEVIRQSPTFLKWAQLENGEKLRYACREFVKGQPTDEERLMRRIMIARRNNLRDHETLKRARRQQETIAAATTVVSSAAAATSASASSATAQAPVAVVHDGGHGQTITAQTPVTMVQDGSHGEIIATPAQPLAHNPRKRRPPSSFSDAQVVKEMDVPAVEATRSYRAWMSLEDGAEFVYNQKYIKGKEGHDWLLRKNIWRRMRYRRENKKMVEKMKSSSVQAEVQNSYRNHQQHKLEQTLPQQQPHVDNRLIDSNIQLLSTANGAATGQGKAETFMETVAVKNAATAMKVDPKLTTEDHSTAIVAGTTVSTSSTVEVAAVAAAAAAAAASSSNGPNSTSDTYDVTQVETDAVEAAVAAAESYVKSHPTSITTNCGVVDNDSVAAAAAATTAAATPTSTNVHDPLGAAAHNAALDAAAKLAAATTEGAAVAAAAAAAAAVAAAASVAASAVSTGSNNGDQNTTNTLGEVAALSHPGHTLHHEVAHTSLIRPNSVGTTSLIHSVIDQDVPCLPVVNQQPELTKSLLEVSQTFQNIHQQQQTQNQHFRESSTETTGQQIAQAIQQQETNQYLQAIQDVAVQAITPPQVEVQPQPVSIHVNEHSTQQHHVQGHVTTNLLETQRQEV